jgi:hypothetical protein
MTAIPRMLNWIIDPPIAKARSSKPPQVLLLTPKLLLHRWRNILFGPALFWRQMIHLIT